MSNTKLCHSDKWDNLKKKSAYLPFVIISSSLLSCLLSWEEKLNEAKYTVQFKNTITHPTHFFNIVLLTDTTYLIRIISTQSKLECIAHNRMPRVLQKNSRHLLKNKCFKSSWLFLHALNAPFYSWWSTLQMKVHGTFQ